MSFGSNHVEETFSLKLKKIKTSFDLMHKNFLLKSVQYQLLSAFDAELLKEFWILNFNNAALHLSIGEYEKASKQLTFQCSQRLPFQVWAEWNGLQGWIFNFSHLPHRNRSGCWYSKSAK